MLRHFMVVHADSGLGIAQSFVDTQLPISPSLDMQQVPDFCCPCGSFRGWKQIKLGGKKLSRSHNDLHLLGSTSNSKAWVWSTQTSNVSGNKNPLPTPGSAPIEQLPPEILGNSTLSKKKKKKTKVPLTAG